MLFRSLILLLENQSVCFAGILREDLEKPDPPVYVSYERDDAKKGMISGALTRTLISRVSWLITSQKIKRRKPAIFRMPPMYG